MQDITLAVKLKISDEVTKHRLPKAVKTVLEWVLGNDIDGAEILTAGPIGEDIDVAIVNQPISTLMSAADILDEFDDDELLEELIRRKRTLIPSIWNIEDFRPVIEENEDCADFTADQVDTVLETFMTQASAPLQDILGERGNEFISDFWDLHKDDLITDIRLSTKTKQP